MNSSDLKIKARAYKDLFYFTKYILGQDLLVDIHKDMSDFSSKPGDDIDLEPRDHFKTTVRSMGYAIWSLENDPTRTFLLNHKIMKKSKEILRGIKFHYEHNEVFRYFFGDRVGNVWRDDEIILKGVKSKQMPSIAVGGVDHEITSGHYTDIINDDICGLRDKYSASERAHTLRYYEALQYCRDQGRFEGEKNTGTRWHPHDVWEHLLKRDIPKRVMQAILSNGKIYFPERYTMERLMEMKKSDPDMFQCQMMNDPLSAREGRTFDIEKLLKYTHEATKYGTDTRAWFDPALSSKQKACYSALVIGTKMGEFVYLRDALLRKEIPDIMVPLVVEACHINGVRELWVENNNAFILYEQAIKKEIHRRGLMIVVRGKPATTNKIGRINASAGQIKQFVKFRDDYDEAYPVLITQLGEFSSSAGENSEYIDGPDALEGLVSVFFAGSEPKFSFL